MAEWVAKRKRGHQNEKNFRALAATLIAVAILCTSALAVNTSTSSKEEKVTLDSGTVVTVETTINSYVGSFQISLPCEVFNEDYSSEIKNVDKVIDVVMVPEASTPALSFKIVSSHPNGGWVVDLGGFDPMDYYDGSNAYRGDKQCFYAAGQGYNPSVSEDKKTVSIGYVVDENGMYTYSDGGLYTLNLAYVPNPTIDAYTSYNNGEEHMTITGEVLVLTQKNVDTFLSTGKVFGYNWPGLKELLTGESAPETPTAPAAQTAIPTSSSVTVNGTPTAFTAYNINGNNYFKLRDLAKVISGSEKEFEVTWDAEKNAINLVSGKAYTEVGGELAAPAVTGNQSATATTSAIYKDSATVTLTAYNINGNNYFKLRDIGAAFNFGVTWDGAKNSIAIDTSIGYTSDK